MGAELRHLEHVEPRDPPPCPVLLLHTPAFRPSGGGVMERSQARPDLRVRYPPPVLTRYYAVTLTRLPLGALDERRTPDSP
jgi:hypothetical protein